MSETALDRLIDRFLIHHARFYPVDATFIGLPGANGMLPPAGPDAAEAERDAIRALRLACEATQVEDRSGQRLDSRMLRAALAHAEAALDCWPRHRQPTWYTGETAFGLISLLLPTAPADAGEALAARLSAAPAFLAAGAAALAGQATPADWCERARRECAAIQRLMRNLPLHPLWREKLAEPAARVSEAAAAFAAAATGLPDRDPACGRDYLGFLMRDVHGLPWSPEEAVDLAKEAFDALGREIAAHPAQGAPPQPTVEPSALPAAYRHWHERVMAKAGALVTPASEFGLAFEPLPDWSEGVAGDTYFLSYRCPPAFGAGAGSTYWTAPAAQSPVAIKQTHAIHHGSIGHHTQNARARTAESRLARLAGADCASGLAFLASGTMVEGWSSYTTELACEIDGLYSPEDGVAALEGARRIAASVLSDIGLHAGGWGLERMRAFYRDENIFPPPRIWGETVRNSILPATRLMYFLGAVQIKALRRERGGSVLDFHDGLIAHGHAPVAWAADEMRRADAQTGT